MTVAPITLAIHTIGQDMRQALIEDVRRGLSERPYRLPPRWFYDERGCALFDKITELPEYYQTRTEAGLLREHAAGLITALRPQSIVELGSGSCAKSRILIDAARKHGSLERFVPFDVSDAAVQQAARALIEEYPGLTVYGIAGDFENHLDQIPRFGRQLVIFLGSTIGNLDEVERGEFLTRVRALLQPGDAFLLGVDLVKDRTELVRAYDDAAGVTAEFNLNVLSVINRELGADFDLAEFQHEARYNEARSRIEMHLRSRRRQNVGIPGAGMIVEFEAGETLRTEISAKFTRESVTSCFSDAGLSLTDWYSDRWQRFALALAFSSR